MTDLSKGTVEPLNDKNYATWRIKMRSLLEYKGLLDAIVERVDVDAVLALILMVGGVIGAQFGARAGQNMRGERLRLLLGLLVFAVGLRFAYELVVQPDDLFSLRHVRSG